MTPDADRSRDMESPLPDPRPSPPVETEKVRERLELVLRNIALLRELGPQITASLDEDTIVGTLYQKVIQLMDACMFGICVFRPDRNQVEVRSSVAGGKAMKPWVRDLENIDPLLRHCLFSGRPVVVNDINTDVSRYGLTVEIVQAALDSELRRRDGSYRTIVESWMYIPLQIHDRVLGAIGVYSDRKHAYSQIDVDTLQSLATYVAVAVQNARTYAELQSVQGQLVQQETMASLGRLVAGVAHEANTPISNIRLSASAAHLRLERIQEELESGSLRKADLKEAVTFLREAMSAIESSSRKAADVVANFKQIAVDQSALQARDFSVAECLVVVVRSLAEQLAGSNIRVEWQIDPLARVHGDPGMFEQIIVHLVNNAAQHAFEGRSSGTISLVVECRDSEVLLRLSDDGSGIPPDIRDKVFSPYFTTKFGRGSSGLGLYIVQNIVTGAFGGSIEFRSQTDSGTTFTITIPAAATGNPH